MNQIARVRGLDDSEERERVAAHLLYVHRPRQLLQTIGEHGRAHELQHQVRRPVVEAAARVHRGHVGRTDREQRVRLTQQRFTGRRIVGARNLDRDVFTGGCALGEKHRAEAALAQRLDDPEPRQVRRRDDIGRPGIG